MGFGQVEPAEFGRFEPYKFGLPPTQTVHIPARGNKPAGTIVRCTRALSDIQAVKVAAALLHDLHLKAKTSQTALEAYAGVQFARDNPGTKPTADERLQIIKGWKNCAENFALFPMHRPPFSDSEQEQILGALRNARGFNSDKERGFRPRLFPPTQRPREFPQLRE